MKACLRRGKAVAEKILAVNSSALLKKIRDMTFEDHRSEDEGQMYDHRALW